MQTCCKNRANHVQYAWSYAKQKREILIQNIQDVQNVQNVQEVGQDMPTYVYACDTCGKQFEHFQSFKDAPLDTCVCGQQGNVRRVFQPVGIVFKGSGWYVTDSRNSTSNTGETSSKSSKETGETASTAPSSESSTESSSSGSSSSDD